MARYCSKCKKLKEDIKFYYRSDKPHLLQSHCKECIIIKHREYRLLNIDRFKEKDKIFHLKNRERRLIVLKLWQQSHKKERLIKDSLRRKMDIHFLLRSRIHNRIRSALVRNSKYSSSETLLMVKYI